MSIKQQIGTSFTFFRPRLSSALYVSMLKTMDCYNPVKFMTAAIFEADKLPALVRDWGGDMTNFLLAAFILIRVWRAVVRRIAEVQENKLPHQLRAQQVRTLAAVITSVGV